MTKKQQQKKKPDPGWVGATLPRSEASRVKVAQRYISKEDVDFDAGGFEREPHITIAYGLPDDVPDHVVPRIASLPKNAEVEIQGADIFDNKDFKVLMYRVDSPELQAVNKAIATYPGFQDKYKSGRYNPHVTVAYLKKDADHTNYVNQINKLMKGRRFRLNDKIRVTVGDREYEDKQI
jgi:2'-5' RNA ligase